MIKIFNKPSLCAVVAALAFCFNDIGEAATEQLQSLEKARQLIRDSLNAHGDHRIAAEAGGMQIRITGTFDLATRLQGRSAFRDEPTEIGELITWDAKSRRVSYEADYYNYYSSNQRYREIYDDKARVVYVDLLNSSGGWLPFEVVPDARARYLRFMPGMLLAEALEHPRSLRYEGHVQRGGLEFDVAGFTTRAGDSLQLFIDANTGLLNSASALIEMPLLGWTTMSWTWSEYTQGDSGENYPARLEVRLGDKPLKNVALSVTFGEFPGAFEAPEGIEIGDPPEALARLTDFVPYGQRPPEVETLMPMVYMVKNLRPGFGLLFVEFDEYVVAVDAPTGWYEMNQFPPMNWSHGDSIDALGHKYLAAIEQTVPGKPVRYLALTHHHSDHIGGFMPFVEAGATVIAGRNAAHMVGVAIAASSELSRDDFLEIVSGQHTITDGSMSMQLIELPDGNPKADNYLMVYLPKQKLLYATGFIYPIPESVFPPRESIPLSKYFVSWLDQSGLETDHIFNVHGMNRVEDWQLETIRQLQGE